MVIKEIVHIVDDEPLVRMALKQVLEAKNYDCRVYETAEKYVEALPVPPVGCALIDIQMNDMNGMNGLELEAELRNRGQMLPIIFISGNGTIPMAVDAVKRGVFHFLEKPFSAERLLDLVSNAVAESRESAATVILLKKLTPREREIFNLLANGMINKVIAAKLDISQGTVEFHRSRVMTKLSARGLEDIILLSKKAAGRVVQ